MPLDILINTKIRTAKPDARPYLGDGAGLFLLVRPSGENLKHNAT